LLKIIVGATAPAALLALLLAVGVAAPAMAAAPPPPNPPSLFISPSGQPFRSLAGEPYPVAKWFAQVDKKGDGHIDRAEFRADAEAFFQVLDKNHDGVIDGFELSEYEHDVAPEILGAYSGVAASGHDGDHSVPKGKRRARGSQNSDLNGMPGAAPYELIDKPEPVAAADRDLTGRISLAVFLAEADKNFDTLDKTSRGYLTLAGLPKTPVQAAMEDPKRRR
jgi:hypothetical protein